MSTDKKIERKKHDPVKGKTDYKRLEHMTDEEIEENAKNDLDLPLLSEEDMKRFKRVNPESNRNEE